MLTANIGVAALLLQASFLIANCQSIKKASVASGDVSAKYSSFEVVSIRPSQPGTMESMRTSTTPTGYKAVGQSIWSTIMLAYFSDNLSTWSSKQLVGTPKWITELYDINARVAEKDLREWNGQDAHHELLRAMLKSLLRDRCNLRIHETAAEGGIYELRLSSKTNSSLQENRQHITPSHTVPLPGGGSLLPGSESITFYDAPMTSVAAFLSRSAGRPVQDQTGLQGRYNLTLKRRELEDDDVAPLTPWRIKDAGLDLKAGRGALKVIVIDHIDRPSAN